MALINRGGGGGGGYPEWEGGSLRKRGFQPWRKLCCQSNVLTRNTLLSSSKFH